MVDSQQSQNSEAVRSAGDKIRDARESRKQIVDTLALENAADRVARTEKIKAFAVSGIEGLLKKAKTAAEFGKRGAASAFDAAMNPDRIAEAIGRKTLNTLDSAFSFVAAEGADARDAAVKVGKGALNDINENRLARQKQAEADQKIAEAARKDAEAAKLLAKADKRISQADAAKEKADKALLDAEARALQMLEKAQERAAKANEKVNKTNNSALDLLNKSTDAGVKAAEARRAAADASKESKDHAEKANFFKGFLGKLRGKS